jgi:hypothetical protein
MAYQIHRIYPRYCPITDGIIGEGAHALPNAYETEGCAFAIAGRLAEADFDAGGDDSFVVTRYGASAFDFRQCRGGFGFIPF